MKINKLFRFVANMKMFYKLMIFIVLIGLIPISTFTIISYIETQKKVEQELIESSNRLFSNYTENVKFKMNLYENIIMGLYYNNTIQQTLDDWTDYDIGYLNKSISQNISGFFTFGKGSGIYGITIYSLNPNFPSDGQCISNISVLEDKWSDKIDLDSAKKYSFDYKVPGLNIGIISLIHPVFSFKTWNKTGIIKLDVFIESLFNLQFESNSQYNNSLYVFNQNNELLYSSSNYQNSNNGLTMVKSLLNAADKPKHSNIMPNKDIVLYDEIPTYNWKLFYVSHYPSINNTMANEKLKVIALGVLVLIVILIITILFSKLFTKRVQKLNNKMAKVQSGNLEINDPLISGNDEIGQLDRYFTECIERIKILIEQNYIEKLEKRDAELVALKLQINPHFLYNTLESINNIAEIKNCPEISYISQNLGKMFRYSINKDSSEFVLLSLELRHVMSYLEIQNIRFNNKFHLITDISDEMVNCMVLKFILQPIVENSINYAFKGMDYGEISISSSIEANYLSISVEDNGAGMTPDKVKEINETINDASFNLYDKYQKSIGLRNVNRRIKLACGNEFGINIISEKDRGTKVIYKLPKNL